VAEGVDSNLAGALATLHVAVVVPAYQAESTISEVLAGIPGFVRSIVVVDDGSSDATAARVREAAEADSRVRLVVRERNGGVGAAMRTGYHEALGMDADIVVKMDSDGQMDPAELARLALPLALGQADYTKGNRFLRPDALRSMPPVRLAGNAALSFLSKLSSGYWNILDPTNGFTAISRDALATLDLDRVDDGFFFESSLLVELGLVRAVVADVAMPSRYGDGGSHLSVLHSAAVFGPKHLRACMRRLLWRYLLTDFSAISLLLAASLPLMAFGALFGARAWMLSSLYGVPATAGTVMLAAFPAAGGLYCLMQAMVYDIMATPQRPLTPPRLALARLPA
jgi:dolichol-phosphate mannosyltransferase